jgi:hypothetical protein
MDQLKDISEITKIDKDNLFQVYVELIEPFDANTLKELKNEFYKNLIQREILYMPYWLVMELYLLKYNVIDIDNYINDKI